MKKPTRQLRQRQRRTSRDRARKCLKRRQRQYTKPHLRYVAPGHNIKAPRRIEIIPGHDASREIGKFLSAVARTVLDQNMPTKLDFRFTEALNPAGAILLYAELNRIISQATVAKPVTIRDPRTRRPREVLKQIRIYELSGDKCDIVPTRTDVVYWQATKGFNQTGDDLKMLPIVTDEVNARNATKLRASDLWRGAAEAVANTVDHAYQQPRADGFAGLPDTRWWMFTQLRDDVFTIAVCDLGCGYRSTIRQTIPERFVAELAFRFRGDNRDAIAIETAMTYGRSGTQLKERGKGSRDAVSLLERHGSGELLILSNTGWASYRFEGGKEIHNKRGALHLDVKGTIVMWRLPLAEA